MPPDSTQFLLTNDDGFDAPGLAALHQAVADRGRAIVVAPNQHFSGCGHQVTAARPLELCRTAPDWYSLDGWPADCARVGLTHVAPRVEWVVSGINEGGNLGADIYMSGTVAAAREACLLGFRSIAISQYIRRRPIDWQQACRWARHVLAVLLERPLEPGCFWNVNLPQPEEPALDPPGCVFCPIDVHPLAVDYALRDGRLHYTPRYQDRPRSEGHDVAVCFSGRIAISKIALRSEPVTATGRPAG